MRIGRLAICCTILASHLLAQHVTGDAEIPQPTNEQEGREVDRSPPNPDRDETPLVSKIEVFGEDYDKDLDFEPTRKKVNVHLEAIAGLCKTETMTLREKVEVLTSHIQELEAIIAHYREVPNLGTDDALFLWALGAMISWDSLSYARPITAKFVKEVDVRRLFVSAYRSRYNLPEDTELDEFPDWAKQIYSGLECLYQE